jgi:hypothetical protein
MSANWNVRRITHKKEELNRVLNGKQINMAQLKTKTEIEGYNRNK